MRVEFAGTVPKDLADEGANEDFYLFSLDGAICALGDGASESFDSRSWATILCERACSGAGISPEQIADAARQYNANYVMETLSWSKAAAFERGSFSTLLLVRHDRARSELEVTAVGDSVLVLCDRGEAVKKFRLSDPDDFEVRPELLSTRDDLNSFLSQPNFNLQHSAVFSVGPSSAALLMTDALGAWLYRGLQEGRSDWQRLLSLESAEEFSHLVLGARADRSMKLDDTTLIRLSFGS